MDRREWIRERERLEARIDTLEGQLHAFLASDAIVHGGAVTDYGEAPRLQTDARAALTKMRMIAARRKVALRAARKRAQEAERAAMEAGVRAGRAALDAIPEVLRLYDEAIREREMFKRRSVERRETCTKLNARAEAAEARERAWFSAGKRALAESEARLAEDRSPRDRTLDELASECGHWRGLCSCKPSVVGHAPDPVADETPSVDPGEGWRLIDRAKEPLELGDEYHHGYSDTWRDCGDYAALEIEIPVRRRITDPVHAPTGDLPPVRAEAPRVEDAAPEVVAATVAERCADGANVTVGVVATCACGLVFADDVRAGLSERTHPAAGPTIVEDEKGRWVIRK